MDGAASSYGRLPQGRMPPRLPPENFKRQLRRAARGGNRTQAAAAAAAAATPAAAAAISGPVLWLSAPFSCSCDRGVEQSCTAHRHAKHCPPASGALPPPGAPRLGGGSAVAISVPAGNQCGTSQPVLRGASAVAQQPAGRGRLQQGTAPASRRTVFGIWGTAPAAAVPEAAAAALRPEAGGGPGHRNQGIRRPTKLICVSPLSIPCPPAAMRRPEEMAAFDRPLGALSQAPECVKCCC